MIICCYVTEADCLHTNYAGVQKTRVTEALYGTVSMAKVKNNVSIVQRNKKENLSIGNSNKKRMVWVCLFAII